MKDATNYILSEFYRILNGHLSYNSIPVKVFGLEQDPADNDTLFVVLKSLYGSDDSTKTNFSSNNYITVDIISRQPGNERSEVKVNAVASQIGQIIVPTPSSTGLQSNNDFAIVNVKHGGPTRAFSNRSNTDLIVRKILTFEVFVHQL